MLLSLLTQADAALTLLTDVFHGLTSLGARPHGDRVAQRLREARGGSPASGPPRTARLRQPAVPRELDVVRPGVSGKTDKEIARALARSPDTIAAQLRSARRKFGAPPAPPWRSGPPRPASPPTRPATS